MNATLIFSTVHGNCEVCRYTLIGVTSIEQAEYVGHGMAGSVSIDRSIACYLSNVSLSNGDFASIPSPEFWREGVTIEDGEIEEHNELDQALQSEADRAEYEAGIEAMNRDGEWFNARPGMESRF